MRLIGTLLIALAVSLLMAHSLIPHHHHEEIEIAHHHSGHHDSDHEESVFSIGEPDGNFLISKNLTVVSSGFIVLFSSISLNDPAFIYDHTFLKRNFTYKDDDIPDEYYYTFSSRRAPPII